MRICKSCDTEYDETQFGTLRKHCSVKCRNTNGGKLPLGRKPGRPRRWAALGEGQKALVTADLIERGWKLHYTAYPGIVMAKKGWWSVSIALGALDDRRHEAYPLIMAQMNSGNIVYKSTCVYGREAFTDDKGLRSFRRKACGKCRRCVAAAWVNSRPMPVYRGKLETNVPALDDSPTGAYTEDHG